MKEETTEDLMVNSIIGEGAEFSGDFKLKGLIRIDGSFRGLLETDGKVLIGETGKVDTDIKAKVVVAGGIIQGNIIASERVVLLSTCKLIGDIVTPRLIIEEGVHFEGKCTVNPRK
ncbi:MAG: polymer-forming cytoskeletal protein [Leptospiraceae bacterium]|nr:polymer-forming cytoskeletal protein [Leptospiraceae bacterium]MCP5498786.1 polymer-forming cytoskeletal protein [Leptospiraceae bacterium]